MPFSYPLWWTEGKHLNTFRYSILVNISTFLHCVNHLWHFSTPSDELKVKFWQTGLSLPQVVWPGDINENITDGYSERFFWNLTNKSVFLKLFPFLPFEASLILSPIGNGSLFLNFGSTGKKCWNRMLQIGMRDLTMVPSCPSFMVTFIIIIIIIIIITLIIIILIIINAKSYHAFEGGLLTLFYGDIHHCVLDLGRAASVHWWWNVHHYYQVKIITTGQWTLYNCARLRLAGYQLMIKYCSYDKKDSRRCSQVGDDHHYTWEKNYIWALYNCVRFRLLGPQDMTKRITTGAN